MELNINNIVEAQGYLLLIAAMYHFVLKRLTFYTFNRFFLLIGSLGAVIVPFIPHLSDMNTTLSPYALPVFEVTQQWQAVLPTANTSWLSWTLLTMFGIGLILCLRTLISTRQLLKGNLVKQNKLQFIVSDHQAAPFSVFNYIVVNQLPLSKEIEIHEAAHVHQKHFVDLLIIQFITWLNWFNPICWYLLKSTKNNHELLADKAVLEAGINKKNYQELMLSRVLHTSVPILSNTFFNQSILKQRIMMMTKKQSNKKALFNALWVLPFALFIFMACDEKKEAAPVVAVAEVMPEFKGGTEAMYAYLSENIIYPKTAVSDSLEGMVYVSFIIDQTGKVTEPTVLRGMDPRFDDVAVSVIANMPDWTPGQNEGKPVAVQFKMPIRFTLQ